MELVLMTEALVGQPLTVCSIWVSGPHLLTEQHSRAGSGGMGAGEQVLRAEVALPPTDGNIGWTR